MQIVFYALWVPPLELGVVGRDQEGLCQANGREKKINSGLDTEQDKGNSQFTL